MSRRDSRVSLNARGTDALSEFENFKKKFLLVNKHITKLNSTLSVRIEELNAQVSSLYVENLRLRASEIALTAQLKKEREKTSKILSETDAAALSLTKHLEFLRHSFNIQPLSVLDQPPKTPTRTARKPVPPTPSSNSPLNNRLARAPNISEIHEEEEEGSSDDGRDLTGKQKPSSPRRKVKTKSRTSTSRLPLPSRAISPSLDSTGSVSGLSTIPVIAEESLGKAKMKPTRRQSGLLGATTSSSEGTGSSGRTLKRNELSVPRAPSPAFGSPIRVHDEDELEEEEMAQVEAEVEVDLDVIMVGIKSKEEMERELENFTRREKKKAKSKNGEAERTRETPVLPESARSREKKRRRDDDDMSSITSASVAESGSGQSRLRDVTNSPPPRNVSRAVLPPLDTTNTDCQNHSPESSPPPSGLFTSGPSSAVTTTSRSFLTTPCTTPSTTPAPQVHSKPRSNSRSEREQSSERPVSQPNPHLPTPRSSSSPVPPNDASEGESCASAPTGGRERRTRKSVNYAEPKLNTKMRKPDPVTSAPTTMTTTTTTQTRKRSSTATSEDEPAKRSSLDREPSPVNTVYTEQSTRPSSRTSTSNPISSTQSLATSSNTNTAMTVRSTITATPSTTVRRKKSRSAVVFESDDESDGAEADAEYIPGGSNKWVNTEGRRGGGGSRRITSADSARRAEGEDGRRRSMMV